MQVKSSVQDYVSDYPNAAYEDIIDRFGTPHQIAAAYVNDMDVPEILNNLQVRRKVVKIAVATAAAVIFLWLGTISISLIYNLEQSNGTIETYIEVIEDIPERED